MDNRYDPRGSVPEPRDDVDRVFAQMRAVEPPPDLKQRVLRSLPAQLPAQQPAFQPSAARGRASREPAIVWRRQWQWVAAITGLLLVILSVNLGGQLEDTGTLGVLGQMLGDVGTFAQSPGDYLEALAAAVPWLEFVLTLGVLGVFWVSVSSMAVPPAARPVRGRETRRP